jgi:hypothetical protein
MNESESRCPPPSGKKYSRPENATAVFYTRTSMNFKESMSEILPSLYQIRAAIFCPSGKMLRFPLTYFFYEFLITSLRS